MKISKELTFTIKPKARCKIKVKTSNGYSCRGIKKLEDVINLKKKSINSV